MGRFLAWTEFHFCEVTFPSIVFYKAPADNEDTEQMLASAINNQHWRGMLTKPGTVQITSLLS